MTAFFVGYLCGVLASGILNYFLRREDAERADKLWAALIRAHEWLAQVIGSRENVKRIPFDQLKRDLDLSGNRTVVKKEER